jgi:hypothetical protein
MKKILTLFSIFIILCLCSCTKVENAEKSESIETPQYISITSTTNLLNPINSLTSTETPATSQATMTITPTYPCSALYESGIFPPTSTPTWKQYRDLSGNITVTITRDIYYDDYRSYCLDHPASDFVIDINKGSEHYILSAVNILRNSSEGSADTQSGEAEDIDVGPIQDLDNDGYEEIPLYLNTMGASCCTTTVIIYYDTSSHYYQSSNGIITKYTLFAKATDMKDDSVPAFVTWNTNFSTDLRASDAEDGIAPIQVYKYINHSLILSTKKYPKAIEEDAQFWLNYYDSPELLYGYDKELTLAAYLSDMYSLGKQEEGEKVFTQKCAMISDVTDCPEFLKKAIATIEKYSNDQ